ncbi:MAG: hypothetical protein QNJ54_25365 [Prochloraceae cyanobacterium]|nr:hypothetical protein [Prochloraceae cyanobacterium]
MVLATNGEQNNLLQTIQQVVTITDGVAEYSSEDILDVVWPREIAETLELSDLITFTTSTEVNGGSYFVTYNSEIFERFEKFIAKDGQVASIKVDYQGYLKPSGFEKLVQLSLVPQNGLLKVKSTKPALTPYLLCNVAYTASADELRLGLLSFLINGVTGVTGVEIGDALMWASDLVESERLLPPKEIESNSSYPEIDWDNLLSICEKRSQELIELEISPWRDSLSRKLNRDATRARDYYHALVEQIKEKMERLGKEEEQLETEKNRIAATIMEKDRKINDLEQRYSLKVEASMHSTLVIWLQTVHIECELIRKKNRRLITAVWNPYTKIVEPLRCAKTGNAVTSFYLSDDDASVISC